MTGQWLHFPPPPLPWCVYMGALMRVFMSLLVFVVHIKIPVLPHLAHVSADMIYYTHTSQPQPSDGDHKSEASSSLAAKKTQGCFSPTKRAINSVSLGVTHFSASLHGKNSSHNPPAIQSQF